MNTSEPVNRRGFLAGASALALLAGCGGSGSGDSGMAAPPVSSPASPTPSPLPSAIATPAPVARPGLVLWGDSRTGGNGADFPRRFPEYVAGLLPTLAVSAQGKAGQRASEIVARQGGAPAMARVEGDTIPGAGSVGLVLSVNIVHEGVDYPVVAIAGTLGDVPGLLLSDGSGRLAFSRDIAGDSMRLTGAVPFRTAASLLAREAITFLCIGQNYGFDEDVVGLSRAAVDYLPASGRRYMVAGVTPQQDAVPGTEVRRLYDAMNAGLQTSHGAGYLDLVTPPSDAEMAAIGYAPSAAERQDIADALYPRGMFSDAVHLSSPGQLIWARRVTAFCRAQDWA